MKYNMDKNHKFKIDTSKSIEEQNVMPETKAILVNIFKNYWANDYQRQRIETKMKQDKLIMEEEKRKEFNPDKVFEKKNMRLGTENSVQTVDNSEALVTVESVRWYEKIVNFFRGLFSRKS